MKFRIALFLSSVLMFGCGEDSESSDEGNGSPGNADMAMSDTEADMSDTEADMSADDDMTECGTVHTVTTTDDTSDIDVYMDFTPENLTISAGDCVEFVMSATHNAIEVSQETYESRGIDSLDGGFAVSFGATQTVRFDEPGTHYYVCIPHVSADMVGTITVE